LSPVRNLLRNYLSLVANLQIGYIARMAHMTREEVERIAHLARLRLSSQEAAAMASDLESILGYVELLGTLDTAQVEPTSHVIPMATPLREDRPGTSYPPEIALANAPARDGSAFAVPKVLEGEDEG
jgi:aspartyl-tRNA(Asn)/glutamyl-tRNA(Gln) amidotransferase subunit C